jgi:DNA-directed RNA polymerase specialized sigma24 family protein
MLLAGRAARLYEMYSVPEVAWILEEPLRTVQQALAGYGVITGRAAVGLRAHGWSLEEIAREWGVSVRWVRDMIASEYKERVGEVG